MTQPSHRCRSCGVPLAQDNASGQCGPCQAADRARLAAPPAVPPEFWETKDMQVALQSCHMGRVIRAFREHLHHGRRGYSQSDVAAWAHTSQARISRLENGPPVLRLDHLDYWAKLLGIPQEHLWFKLPENRGPRAPTPVDWPLEDGEHRAAPHEDTSPHETGLSWGTNDGAGVRHAVTGPPQRSGEIEGESDDARIGDAPRPDGDRDLTPTLPNPPIHIDIETAQPARIADYLLGGQANFAVDRDVIDYIIDPLPGGGDTAKATTRAGQDFKVRVARYLVSEVGLQQLLYIGTRLPTGVKVHEVAQETMSSCRVVYVIDDDVTLAHAHRLASSTPDAVSAYIRGSLSDPAKLLRQAGATLDLMQPVGITVQGSLHQIPDDDDACRIVGRLLAAVPSGSYLAISHLTSDLLGEQMAKSLERLEQMVEASKMQALTLRSQAQIARLFDGLDMVDPGIVPVDKWRPDGAEPDVLSDLDTLMYAAVARKP